MFRCNSTVRSTYKEATGQYFHTVYITKIYNKVAGHCPRAILDAYTVIPGVSIDK